MPLTLDEIEKRNKAAIANKNAGKNAAKAKRAEKQSRLDSLGLELKNCGAFDPSTMMVLGDRIEFVRNGRKYIITEAEE